MRAVCAVALLIACSCTRAENGENALPFEAPGFTPDVRDDAAVGAVPVFGSAVDSYGDRLPVHAVQRLGTSRLRHRTSVTSLAWAGGGRVLVSADRDGEVRTWDGHSGRRLHRLSARGIQVATSPTGASIAVRGAKIAVYETATGASRWEYEPGPSEARALAFAPDGLRIALGVGPVVEVVTADTGVRVGRFTSGQDRIDRVAWSPDARWLAAADRNGLVVVLDSRSGAARTTFQVAPGAWPVTVLEFAPDGATLAAGREPIEVRDSATGTFHRDLEGKGPGEGALFLPDGELLVCHPGPPHSLTAWDTATASSRPLWPDLPDLPAINAVAPTPTGDRLAVADARGHLAIRDLGDGHVVDERIGHMSEISALVLSAGSDRAWTAGAGGRVLSWDLASGRETALSDVHEGGAHSLALSPEGTRLLSGGWDGVVREWDVASGLIRRTFATGAPVAVAYRHDGAPVSWSTRGLLAWDPDGPTTLVPPAKGPLALSADGRRAVVGHVAGMTVVDLDDGSIVARLDAVPVPPASLHSASWSPDGRQVALGGADGRIWLVEAARGDQARVLHGPGGLVTAVAWSPDGMHLASAHRDGTWVWDVARGERTGTLIGHDDFTTQVVWTPDGRRIATAGADGTVLVWEPP